MKKLFTLILFLLSLTPTLVAQTSEPAGSAPEAGESYYLYNVDKRQYLSAGSDGTLTLGTPYLEVTLSQPTTTTTADADFYTIEANGKKLLAALWQTPVLGDSKQNYYDQWQFSAVSGKTNVYTLGCRNRAAGSMMYMYWSDIKDGLSTVLLKIWTSFDNAQWKLVSKADVEKQVITLDETAETYTSTTINSEATVQLKRTLSQNCWNSFCVPFDIDATQLKAQFGDDMKVAELTGMTSTTFDFTSVTYVKAGTPYLLYPTADAPTEGYYTFTGVTSLLSSPTNKTVSNGGESITYQGSFCKTTATKGAYVLRKNILYHLQSDMTMEGFRAMLTPGTAASKVFTTWTLDSETTGISNIKASTGTSFDVYNTGGQMIRHGATTTDDLPQGVYIVNGKKITK